MQHFSEVNMKLAGHVLENWVASALDPWKHSSAEPDLEVEI